MPLHPRAYSLTYSVKKFVICYEGDPGSFPPFAPRRLFGKFEALALPNFQSEKSEKISWGRGMELCLRLTSFVAVYRTVSVLWNILKICQKIFGGDRVPQSPVWKILKKYEVWRFIVCSKPPSFVLVSVTVSEIFDLRGSGNSPYFQNW